LFLDNLLRKDLAEQKSLLDGKLLSRWSLVDLTLLFTA
jgi:hypothetical protein